MDYVFGTLDSYLKSYNQWILNSLNFKKVIQYCFIHVNILYFEKLFSLIKNYHKPTLYAKYKPEKLSPYYFKNDSQQRRLLKNKENYLVIGVNQDFKILKKLFAGDNPNIPNQSLRSRLIKQFQVFLDLIICPLQSFDRQIEMILTCYDQKFGQALLISVMEINSLMRKKKGDKFKQQKLMLLKQLYKNKDE